MKNITRVLWHTVEEKGGAPKLAMRVTYIRGTQEWAAYLEEPNKAIFQIAHGRSVGESIRKLDKLCEPFAKEG